MHTVAPKLAADWCAAIDAILEPWLDHTARRVIVVRQSQEREWTCLSKILNALDVETYVQYCAPLLYRQNGGRGGETWQLALAHPPSGWVKKNGSYTPTFFTYAKT